MAECQVVIITYCFLPDKAESQLQGSPWYSNRQKIRWWGVEGNSGDFVIDSGAQWYPQERESDQKRVFWVSIKSKPNNKWRLALRVYPPKLLENAVQSQHQLDVRRVQEAVRPQLQELPNGPPPIRGQGWVDLVERSFRYLQRTDELLHVAQRPVKFCSQ